VAMDFLVNARVILEKLAPQSFQFSLVLKEMASLLRKLRDWKGSLQCVRRACAILLSPRIQIVPYHPVYISAKLMEAELNFRLQRYSAVLHCTNDILGRLELNDSAWARYWKARALDALGLSEEAKQEQHQLQNFDRGQQVLNILVGSREVCEKDLDQFYKQEALTLHNQQLNHQLREQQQQQQQLQLQLSKQQQQ